MTTSSSEVPESERIELNQLIPGLLVAIETENQHDIDFLMKEINKFQVSTMIECLIEWCLILASMLASATEDTTESAIGAISLALQYEEE